MGDIRVPVFVELALDLLLAGEKEDVGLSHDEDGVGELVAEQPGLERVGLGVDHLLVLPHCKDESVQLTPLGVLFLNKFMFIIRQVKNILVTNLPGRVDMLSSPEESFFVHLHSHDGGGGGSPVTNNLLTY